MLVPTEEICFPPHLYVLKILVHFSKHTSIIRCKHLDTPTHPSFNALLLLFLPVRFSFILQIQQQSCLRVYMPCAHKGPMLGLMICCGSLEILNNFMFELAFYKWSLMRQWGTHVVRGDVLKVQVCDLWCSLQVLHLQGVMSTETQWTPNVWEFSVTQREYKVSVLYLWPNKQKHWQPEEAIVCGQTRTYFKSIKKAMQSEKHKWPRNLNTHLFLCY